MFGGGWANTSEDWHSASRSGLKPLRNKDPLADEILRQQQRFHETLAEPHLRFHIRVLAQTPAVARLLASVVGESAFEEGSYQLFDYAADDPLFEEVANGRKDLRSVPAPALAKLLGKRDIRLYDGMTGLANVAPVDQLTSVFRLPLASYGSPCCIRKNTDPPVQNADEMIVLGYDEQSALGSSTDEVRPLPRGIRTDLLVKHAFVAGVPGSGKTTSIINLLRQLHHRGIPFVVFEPAKSEYRRFKCLKDHRDARIQRLSRELQVYTPGNEEISPFRFNPLRLLPGISRDEHIENLITCFKAAMPMFAAFPAILGEALEGVYKEHPEPEKPPTMTDLQAVAETVLTGKDYSGEIYSNLRAAIDVRLGLLKRRAIGHVFQGGPDSPSIDCVLKGSTIIELGNLPVEQACLLTLFVLTAVRERVRTTAWSGDGVRFVIVLEEAHNIVGTGGDAVQSEEQADPKAFAAEFICLMLAELRALGVAIIIADQLPSAVAPEVIKNTASKLAFRQVANEDREELGGTMLFGPIETEEIARLQPGEAYFFTEGYFAPRRVRTPDLNAELNLPSPPVGKAILPYLRDDPWFIAAFEDRAFEALGKLMHEMEKLDAKRDEIRNLSRRMSDQLKATVDMGPEQRVEQRSKLARCAKALRKQLDSAFNVFVNDVYSPILGSVSQEEISSETLRAYYEHLVVRFESKIRPGVVRGLNFFDRKIKFCEGDSN